MTQYVCHADYNLMRNAHQVWIGRSSRYTKPETLVWTWASSEEGQIIPDNQLLIVDQHEVRSLFQSLLDQAWQLGLRPAHYQDDNKELSAVRGHLADMRALVFKEVTVKP